MVLVPTNGNGSLDAYSRNLAELTGLTKVPVDGASGSFNHRLLSTRALRYAAHDAAAVMRLRAAPSAALHFTSQHLGRYGPFVGRPYLVTVHDLIRYRDCTQRDLRPPLIHRPNLRDRICLRRDAAGLIAAEALIAVSHHTKRELVEQLGIDAARVHVVHEGVDRAVFRPVTRRRIDDPYVLYVGSEQPRKNLPVLLRAFMRLREGTGLETLRLVKVGAPGGPEAPYRRMFLAEAQAVGALEHLLLAERVSQSELVSWYSGALCLALPSRHEGFGLAPLEAMACGCPAVISDAGALPEVAAGAGAVYGPPDDVEALARTIERVVLSPAHRAVLVDRGLRRAAELSWERTAEQTLAVYERVLGSATGGSTADAVEETPLAA